MWSCFLPDRAESPVNTPPTSTRPSSTCTQKTQTSDDWKTRGFSDKSRAPVQVYWAKKAELSNPEPPFFPPYSLSTCCCSLSERLSVSLLSSPCVCLSQLLPVHCWGMSHSGGVRGLEFQQQPSHVPQHMCCHSESDESEGGREGEMKRETRQLFVV